MLSKSYGVASFQLHAALAFASSSVSVTSVASAPSASGVLVELQGDYAELSFVDEGGDGTSSSRVAFVKPHDEAKLHLQGGSLVRDGASRDADARQCGYGAAPALPSTAFSPVLSLSPGGGEPATIVFGDPPTGGAADTRVALQISADGRALTVVGGTILIDGVDLKARCA